MPTCPAGHTSGADDYCDICGTRMSGPTTSAPTTSAPTTGAPTTGAPPPAGGTGAPGECCPDCSAARTGRFCEDCGYDFALGSGRLTATGPMRLAPPARTVPPGVTGPMRLNRPEVSEPMATKPPDPVTGPTRMSGPQTGPVAMSGPQTGPAAWTAVVTADREYYEAVVRESGEGAAFAFPPYCPERRIPLTGSEVRIGRRSVSRGVVPEIDLGEPPGDPGASHTHAVLLAREDGSWSLVDPGSTNGTTVNGGTDPIAVNVEVPLVDGDRIHVGVWTTITLRRG